MGNLLIGREIQLLKELISAISFLHSIGIVHMSLSQKSVALRIIENRFSVLLTDLVKSNETKKKICLRFQTKNK